MTDCRARPLALLRGLAVALGLAAAVALPTVAQPAPVAHEPAPASFVPLAQEPVPVSVADRPVLPAGYSAAPLAAWGEPVGLAAAMPAFKPDASNTAAEQALFGEPGMPAPKAGWSQSVLTALFETEAWADITAVQSAYGRANQYQSVRARLQGAELERAAAQALQQAWTRGETVDVGGSAISAALAEGARTRSLACLAPPPAPAVRGCRPRPSAPPPATAWARNW